MGWPKPDVSGVLCQATFLGKLTEGFLSELRLMSWRISRHVAAFPRAEAQDPLLVSAEGLCISHDPWYFRPATDMAHLLPKSALAICFTPSNYAVTIHPRQHHFGTNGRQVSGIATAMSNSLFGFEPEAYGKQGRLDHITSWCAN